MNGALVILGLVPKEHKFDFIDLVFNTKKITGSNIGGIKNTEELIDFCNKNKI